MSDTSEKKGGMVRVSIVALTVGIAAGLIVAFTMSLLDWHRNPSGIFHGAQGPDWAIVMETALSWFVPVAALASAVSLPFLYWLRRRG